MRTYLALVVVTLLLTGCAEPTGGSASSPSSNEPAAGSGSGVARTTSGDVATGYWSKTQVETWLKQDLKLTTLSLSAAGDHNYTGTGTTVDGRTYQLKVTQVPGGIACKFDSGTGSSGRIAFGNTVHDD
jgi:hypothetical protein